MLHVFQFPVQASTYQGITTVGERRGLGAIADACKSAFMHSNLVAFVNSFLGNLFTC